MINELPHRRLPMERIKNLASAVTRVALLSGALLSVAVPASAAIVPSWSWSQGITFTSATFGPPSGNGCQTVSPSLIQWGSCSNPIDQSRVVIQTPNQATDITSGVLAITSSTIPVPGVVL